MSQVVPPPIPPPLAKAAPILRAQGLRKAFRMGDQAVTVLKDVDLTLRPGEFVAIEGRSGSGKSTLLHILGALDVADEGTVEFEGRDYTRRAESDAGPVVRLLAARWLLWVSAGLAVAALVALAAWRITSPGPQLIEAARLKLLPPGELAAVQGDAAAGRACWFGMVAAAAALVLVAVPHAVAVAVQTVRYVVRDRAAARVRNREFGFVFQFYHLLPELNVLENTMLSQMIESSWLGFLRRRGALRRKATEVLDSLGMAHRLRHRPSQLSGGERQRVAIARALMNDPRVLFADEPTGNLDAETGRQIMAVLERLHQEHGQTVVMVTHDRTLARRADRVLVMKDGKLERAEG